MLQYKNIVGALMILSICAVVSYAQMGETPLPQIVDGQHIIVMKAKQGIPIDLEAAVTEAGGEVVSTVPEVGIAVAASDAEDFAEQMSKHAAVQNVLPQLNIQWIPKDMDFHPCSIGDNETLYGYQWNMPAIEAPGAWDAGYTGAGARVADLDSGIDIDHPDLAPNIDFAASRSFALDWMWVPDVEEWIPPEPFIDDLDGHGTWTAGIIAAADNEYGVIGVAPEATIIAVKVLNKTGSGFFSWIINGIVYAATQADADVINMSLSGAFPKSDARYDPFVPYYLSLFNRAVNFAARQGVTVVCSAGNEAWDLNHNWDWVVLPAEDGNGMAVSATGPLSQQDFDTPAFYTNYGTSVIEVAGPGATEQVVQRLTSPE
jgi:subtilisin family serine protease